MEKLDGSSINAYFSIGFDICSNTIFLREIS